MLQNQNFKFLAPSLKADGMKKTAAKNSFFFPYKIIHLEVWICSFGVEFVDSHFEKQTCVKVNWGIQMHFFLKFLWVNFRYYIWTDGHNSILNGKNSF